MRNREVRPSPGVLEARPPLLDFTLPVPQSRRRAGPVIAAVFAGVTACTLPDASVPQFPERSIVQGDNTHPEAEWSTVEKRLYDANQEFGPRIQALAEKTGGDIGASSAIAIIDVDVTGPSTNLQGVRTAGAFTTRENDGPPFFTAIDVTAEVRETPAESPDPEPSRVEYLYRVRISQEGDRFMVTHLYDDGPPAQESPTKYTDGNPPVTNSDVTAALLELERLLSAAKNGSPLAP